MFAAVGLPAAAQQAAVQPAKVRQELNKPAQAKPAQTKPVAPAAAVASSEPAGGARLTAVALREPGSRRDPFSSLVSGKDKLGGIPEHLPPGKAGLMITTLRLDGVVRGPTDMIAIVSNAQQRVYFLRDGDRLYDGQVGKISMEGVAFRQSGKDPFGKPVQREIFKRLYPTSGEQQ